MFSQEWIIYLLIAVPALLGWYAQRRVRSAYAKYSDVPNGQGLSGLELAQLLLRQRGLTDVRVEEAPGQMSDHYDPSSKTLRLSRQIAESKSATSLGVVAHEVGHALQHAEGHRFLQLRGNLARRLSQAARFSPLVFVGGMLMGNLLLMAMGIVILAGFTLYALVTLPVERDASKRALAMLEQAGAGGGEAGGGARAVLRAAAFTCAAAMGQRVASFAFFALLATATFGGAT